MLSESTKSLMTLSTQDQVQQRWKLDSTTEAYCEIEIAERNKRRRENPRSGRRNVMEAFRSRIRAAVRARKEQETAVRAIDEARAEVEGETRDSDDASDTAPPNGFDGILNEVCKEAGYHESDESDEGAW